MDVRQWPERDSQASRARLERIAMLDRQHENLRLWDRPIPPKAARNSALVTFFAIPLLVMQQAQFSQADLNSGIPQNYSATASVQESTLTEVEILSADNNLRPGPSVTEHSAPPSVASSSQSARIDESAFVVIVYSAVKLDLAVSYAQSISDNFPSVAVVQTEYGFGVTVAQGSLDHSQQALKRAVAQGLAADSYVLPSKRIISRVVVPA